MARESWDKILAGRNYSLEAQVDAIVKKTEKRMLVLMQESLQELVNQANLPTAKGGRMRVDTGFLRASGQASLNGMPNGPARGESKVKGFYDDGSKPINVSVALAQMKFGSTFFFGWTANYAKYREAYDGFLYGAIQNWQKIVDDVATKIKARYK